jgi:histidinol-phosphate aminotransferase
MSNHNFSRRGFLGTITGAAALAILGLERRAMADRAPGDNMVTDYVGRLCFNENPLGPSPAALQAIQESAEMAHRYPDWFAESLISRLASKYDVSATEVICGVGATEIIRFCAQAFGGPGTNVVVPNPSYGQFASDAEKYGSSVRYVDLDEEYRVDLGAMLGAVDSDTAAVCVTNPNNPTATVVDASGLVDFVDELPNDVVAIIDEAYYDYMSEYQSAVEMVRSGRDVVVVKTFSKVYGLAGARIGFAIGRQSRISAMSAFRMYAMISRMSLEAAEEALDDDQHVADTVELANQTKEYCFGEFDRMELEYIPSVASFFMVDVGQNAEPVRSALASRGIYVRTGWGMPNHLRVSTGTMEEMVDFIAALEDILTPLKAGEDPPKPAMTELYQAYPNPFNSSTRISIYIPKSSKVTLEIFDIRGRLVKTLVDRRLGAGEYRYRWNGKNNAGETASSGSYFYRLISGDDVITRRMILLK